MESQKLEDLLQLSLQATEAEREKSGELGTGYERETETWELIVKYHGSAEGLQGDGIEAEPLLNGYAVIRLKEDRMAEFVSRPQIEFVEMPKKLLPEAYDGRRESCILEVTKAEPYLSGKDILVGIIDSGVDIFHEEFRDENGRTRILGYWDQTGVPYLGRGLEPPEGFLQGIYYSREQIDAILQGEDTLAPIPVDSSGHGTAVASIAAGSRIGVAPGSELLVVKLGDAAGNAFPRTTQLMRGVHFLVTMAQSLGRPIAVNISFGNCYGDHHGSSLLERFLNNASEAGRNVIVVGSGNEAAANGHFRAHLEKGGTVTAELSVGEYETSLSLQLWKQYQDVFRITLTSPSGETLVISQQESSAGFGVRRAVLGGSHLLCFLGQPLPYSVMQEYYFDFIPLGSYVDSGIWNVQIEAAEVKDGNAYLYLPSYTVRSSRTGFYEASPFGSFTIPSTADAVVTAGAYDPVLRSYAGFSGRGFDWCLDAGHPAGKPDIVAPGVDVIGAAAGGGYGSFTGTSFAAPYVAGSCALLMEWGITKGHDPYLYGQKCKAYLVRGAQQLPAEAGQPNPKTGWGALCLAASLPNEHL